MKKRLCKKIVDLFKIKRKQKRVSVEKIIKVIGCGTLDGNNLIMTDAEYMRTIKNPQFIKIVKSVPVDVINFAGLGVLKYYIFVGTYLGSCGGRLYLYKEKKL